MTPLLEDPNATFERAYYHGENGTTPASQCLFDDETKYVWFPETGEELLFELNSDPRERTDVSTTEEYSSELVAWRERMVESLETREERFVVDGQLRRQR